jgi:hypothetical protein
MGFFVFFGVCVYHYYYNNMTYKNPKQRLEVERRWREAHREYMREYYRQYYASHKKERQASLLKWQEHNHDKIARYKKHYRRSEAGKACLKTYRKKLSKQTKDLKESIKTFYGCMNPTCKWHGEFHQQCLIFIISTKQQRSSISAKDTQVQTSV